MKNRSVRVLMIVACVCLVLVLLVTSLEMSVHDMDFWRGEYVKYGIPEYTGIEEDELVDVTEKLLNYMRGDGESLENVCATVNGEYRVVFNERERAHMVDVQALYKFVLGTRIAFFLVAMLAVLVANRMTEEKTRKLMLTSFLWGSVIVVGLIAIIAAFAAIDFDAFWTTFHHVFFTNDLWLLDPATDIMIQMMPAELFYDICMRFFLIFGGILGGFDLLAGIALIARRKKDAAREAEELAEQKRQAALAHGIVDGELHDNEKAPAKTPDASETETREDV